MIHAGPGFYLSHRSHTQLTIGFIQIFCSTIEDIRQYCCGCSTLHVPHLNWFENKLVYNNQNTRILFWYSPSLRLIKSEVLEHWSVEFSSSSLHCVIISASKSVKRVNSWIYSNGTNEQKWLRAPTTDSFTKIWLAFATINIQLELKMLPHHACKERNESSMESTVVFSPFDRPDSPTFVSPSTKIASQSETFQMNGVVLRPNFIVQWFQRSTHTHTHAHSIIHTETLTKQQLHDEIETSQVSVFYPSIYSSMSICAGNHIV